MGCCGGDKAGAEARAQEEQRQRDIAAGMANIDRQFAGFDQAFYDKRKQDQLAFALPQVSQQRQGANRAVSFQLARQGLLRSSAAEQAARELDQQTGLSLQQVSDQAAESANQLRRDVEGERSNLLSQLHASGDPALAASRAIATSANLRLPSPLAPVGRLFEDLTNQYTNKQLAGVWNATAGGTGPSYSFRSAASPMPSQTSRIIK